MRSNVNAKVFLQPSKGLESQLMGTYGPARERNLEGNYNLLGTYLPKGAQAPISKGLGK